jgi:hypothetical protein
MRNQPSYIKLTAIFVFTLLCAPFLVSASAGTIDPANKYAWGSYVGWVNFNPTGGNVAVTGSELTGDLWSENYGWINLAPSSGGVLNDGLGDLSGSAWGENIGWIDFSGVTIDGTTGTFSGATSTTSLGEITFDCANCRVVTTWRSQSAATAPAAPTGVVATGGNTSATVSFAAPADGGAAITGYTVTSNPAGGTDSNAGSTSLTHAVTGLTNGTPYTFAVTATNSVGTGSDSSPSNSVSPAVQADTYSFIGPMSGTVSTVSANFTVTPDAKYLGTITITPSGGGLSTPIVLNFSGSSTAQTFTVTPTSAGMITLNPSNSGALTDPASLYYTVLATSSGGRGGGGLYGPKLTLPVTAPTDPSSSTTASSSPTTIRLVNSNGTLYLIESAVRYGITAPGILFSYGLAFSDAKTATSADMSLPASSSLLPPGNGSLVKSVKDPTVYFISQDQKYAFTSASVFLGLGFKWSSVLVVTDPELQALPMASPLSSSSVAHLAGTDVLDDGTVYWIDSNNAKEGYPSLAIYNSWHMANGLSTVVPANSADIAMPVSGIIHPRVMQ